ncbi:MAG: hypothetical protein OEL78_08215 [Hyphomicrobiales bacterium]|nr:hypothetical protein [Hyphomicrobiales bacterium]
MSYPLIGALVGLAFAIAEFFMFGVLITRAAERGETGRGADILDMIRKAQIVIFPAAGWIAGSLLG